MRCEHKSFGCFLKKSLKRKENSLAFLPYHLDFNIDVMTGVPAANLGQGDIENGSHPLTLWESKLEESWALMTMELTVKILNHLHVNFFCEKMNKLSCSCHCYFSEFNSFS